MKRKIAALVLSVCQLFLLSGCWNYREIDDQINVAGIALDIGEQGCRCHLTAEIATVGSGENARFESHIVESDGDTVFEAIRNLMTLTPKKLYFGHCETLIIGEPLAQYGIRELLDLPIRNHEMRADMNIVIAKGTTGKRLLETKGITTNIVSYKISSILKTSEKAVGKAAASKDYLVYNGIHTAGFSVTVPALELYKLESDDGVNLCGAAVFREDKLIGYLDEEQLKDLSLMMGKLKTGLLTTEAPGSPYYNTSFEIHKTHAETKVSCDGSSIAADCRVKLWVNVGETQLREDFLNPAEVDATRRVLETSLCQDLSHLVEAAQQTYRCDIFGIGRKIEQQDPDCWKKHAKNWREDFSKVHFKISCEVIVNGSGVSNIAPA